MAKLLHLSSRNSFILPSSLVFEPIKLSDYQNISESELNSMNAALALALTCQCWFWPADISVHLPTKRPSFQLAPENGFVKTLFRRFSSLSGHWLALFTVFSCSFLWSRSSQAERMALALVSVSTFRQVFKRISNLNV